VLISLATGAGALGYASGDIFPAVGRPGTLLAVNAPVTVLQVVGFVVAAPHGIAAVAGVHLGINVAYGVARLALANRLVGSTWLANLAAMRPALCVAGSMAACAIPVRLVTPPGAWSLVAIVAAGSVGAAAGLAMSGRSNVADLVALARDLRSARRS